MLSASGQFWNRWFARKLFLWAALLFLLPWAAVADQSVTLVWNASPDTNAVGYKIYYGGTSQNYTNVVTLGNVTSVTISGLIAGATYYFAATAVSASGDESVYSNEAAYVVPLNAVITRNPALAALPDLSVYQNAGLQTLAVSGIDSGLGDGNLNVSVSAVTSDSTIISNPTVNYIAGSSSGILSFAPVAGASGTATVTVTVNNGSASNNLASQAFSVTITPAWTMTTTTTFDPLSNFVIYQNAGAQTVMLTNINSGLADGNQNVSVTAVSSDSTIISTPVANYVTGSNSASLIFSPVGVGTATVTVTVYNGSDSNNPAIQTFTVTVLPVVMAAPPTLDSLPDMVIYQNAGVQTVSLTDIASGLSDGNQNMSVFANTSDPTVISPPTVGYAAGNNFGSLTFAPALNAVGTAIIMVMVNNGNSNNNLFTRSFTITVLPIPVPTTPPALNTLANLTIKENAGMQTVALTSINSGLADGNLHLTISASSSNPGLIAPSVNYASGNNFGSLTFAPATNAKGTAILTVMVNNGAASNNIISQTFTVTVQPSASVNQPPTLNPISNITLVQGTALQTVMLTGIASGSPTERQILKVSASSSNPCLVPVPMIRYTSPASTAQLTLRPTGLGVGVATITVTVNDGGRSNNIVRQSFTVTVQHTQPPTLDPIPNLAIAENASAQTINLTGITSGSRLQNLPLHVSATSSNPHLLPAPQVQYASPSSSARLTFRPLPNLAGTVTITVLVNNGNRNNSVARQQFTVTVAPPTSNATVVNSGAAQPAVLSAVTHAAGEFSFQVTGVAGDKYVVQATSDLVHWTSVQTNTAPFVFHEQTTGSFGQRFYRAYSTR